MPIPLSITDLSVTPASNSPQGTEPMGTNADDYIRSHAAIIRQIYDAIVGGSVVNLVPAGTIIMSVTGTTPAGWIICDGRAISRSTFSVLYGIVGTSYGIGDGSTTFNVPDLRGVFVRGWDGGRGVDPGRAFGSLQGHQMPAHAHTASSSAAPNHTHANTLTDPGHVHNMSDPGHAHNVTGTSTPASGSYAGAGVNMGNITTSLTSTNTSGITQQAALSGVTLTNAAAGAFAPTITVAQAGAGSETRPINIALAYLIKT